MTSAPPVPQSERLSAGEVGAYCLGAVGSNLVYAAVSMFLMVFYTDVVGIPAAAIGTLFLLVRLSDGVTDVVMGIIVDNTQTRWGRFRPYLVAGGMVSAMATAACFTSPTLGPEWKLAWAYVTYILWSLSYTICDIPYWSLTPAMTADPVERTRVVAASRTAAQIGYWAMAILGIPLAHHVGWWAIGAVAGVGGLIGFLTTFAGTTERHVLPRRKRQTIGGFVRLLIANRPLRYLMASCLLMEAMSGLRGAMAIYYFKYYLNNASLIPWYMGMTFAGSVAGCLLAPVVASRIGKVNTARYPFILLGVMVLATYGVRDAPMGVLAMTLVVGFFDGMSNIGRMSCLADCVEYGQWKTGNRAEGMVYSTNIFKTKLASAIAGSGGAYLLAGIGFVANEQQSDTTLMWLALIFTIGLGLGSVIAALPMFAYELNESRYRQILSDLDWKQGAES